MYGSLEVNMREIESPNYTFAIMCSRRFNDIGLLAIADKYGDEFKPPIGYFLELNGEYLKNEKPKLSRSRRRSNDRKKSNKLINIGI